MATSPWRSDAPYEVISLFGMTHRWWSGATPPSKCMCGFNPELFFSWLANPDDVNPEGRFWICAGITGKECNFSKWEEPGICSVSKLLIYCMVKRINQIEAIRNITINKYRRLIVFLLLDVIVSIWSIVGLFYIMAKLTGLL